MTTIATEFADWSPALTAAEPVKIHDVIHGERSSTSLLEFFGAA